MIRRSSRFMFLVLTLMAASLAVAQPLSASSRVGYSGTVGDYSVTDTAANPGATGSYRYNSDDGFGWLKRFYVKPPGMRAVAGMNSQTVGWLFNVQRKICGIGGCGRWTVTYTSPEMTAVTDDTHDAAFSQATVRVRVPCGHNCADAGANYRINMKMIWHRANGSVQGTAKHRIYYYRAEMNNGQSGLMEQVAWDAWSPDFSAGRL